MRAARAAGVAALLLAPQRALAIPERKVGVHLMQKVTVYIPRVAATYIA